MPQVRVVVLAVVAWLGALPLTAIAQEVSPLVRERISVGAANQQREPTVRVQVGVNFFMPGPTGEGDEASKLRDRARRTIYDMAAKECDFIEQSLAKTCRLESINLNVNSSRQQIAGQEGFQTNGSFALQITLK